MGFAATVGSGAIPAPDFTLRVDAEQDGRMITYTIHFENVGTSNASTVTLRDVFPEGAAYAGDPGDLVDGVWVKTYAAVAPGAYEETVTVELSAVVAHGDRVVNYVEIEYVGLSQVVTKAYWHEMGVEFAPAPQPGFPALVAVAPLAGGAAAVAGFVAYRPRRRPQLEQVFLMHSSGMLIHHWAANVSPTRDLDILSGMFMIMKEFVRDSFREKKGGLTELQFGDSRIFLAEGRHAVLAAVASGRRVNGLPGEIASAVADFERIHGGALTGWVGRLDELPGAKSVVDGLVHGRYRNWRMT